MATGIRQQWSRGRETRGNNPTNKQKQNKLISVPGPPVRGSSGRQLGNSITSSFSRMLQPHRAATQNSKFSVGLKSWCSKKSLLKQSTKSTNFQHCTMNYATRKTPKYCKIQEWEKLPSSFCLLHLADWTRPKQSLVHTASCFRGAAGRGRRGSLKTCTHH